MAENVSITAGSGTVIAADQVTQATLGTAMVQYMKIMDATIGGTNFAVVKTAAPASSDGGLVTRSMLYDSNGNAVVVKAASTAAVAADPALVVALSPNSQGYVVPGALTGTSGTITAASSISGGITTPSSAAPGAGSTVTFTTTTVGASAFFITVNASGVGVYTGSMLVDVSLDGTTFITTSVYNISSAVYSGTISAAGYYIVVGPYLAVRVRLANGGTVTTAPPITITPSAANSLTVQANSAARVLSTPSGTDAALAVALSPNSATVSQKVTDGTNTSAVKAASTAPVATDPALVVTLSPNSTFPTDNSPTGALNGLNAAVSAALNGRNACSVNIPAATTLVGTLVAELSFDGGTTYPVQTNITLPGTSSTVVSLAVASGTATQFSVLLIPGATNVRVRVSAFTSGTATAALNVTNGSAALSTPVKLLPANGTGLAAVPVYTNAIQLATYTISARNIATGTLVANTAKAVLSLHHAVSATKTVRVRRLLVSGYQTTALAGTLDIQITTGTAATTGGSVITPGKRNLADPNAEMIATSLPTITAAVVQDNLPFAVTPTTTATGQGSTVLYDWQEAGETKPWTLRAGVLESFVLNAISTAAQSWILTVHLTVTEE